MPPVKLLVLAIILWNFCIVVKPCFAGEHVPTFELELECFPNNTLRLPETYENHVKICVPQFTQQSNFCNEEDFLDATWINGKEPFEETLSGEILVHGFRQPLDLFPPHKAITLVESFSAYLASKTVKFVSSYDDVVVEVEGSQISPELGPFGNNFEYSFEVEHGYNKEIVLKKGACSGTAVHVLDLFRSPSLQQSNKRLILFPQGFEPNPDMKYQLCGTNVCGEKQEITDDNIVNLRILDCPLGEFKLWKDEDLIDTIQAITPQAQGTFEWADPDMSVCPGFIYENTLIAKVESPSNTQVVELCSVTPEGSRLCNSDITAVTDSEFRAPIQFSTDQHDRVQVEMILRSSDFRCQENITVSSQLSLSRSGLDMFIGQVRLSETSALFFADSQYYLDYTVTTQNGNVIQKKNAPYVAFLLEDEAWATVEGEIELCGKKTVHRRAVSVGRSGTVDTVLSGNKLTKVLAFRHLENHGIGIQFSPSPQGNPIGSAYRLLPDQEYQVSLSVQNNNSTFSFRTGEIDVSPPVLVPVTDHCTYHLIFERITACTYKANDLTPDLNHHYIVFRELPDTIKASMECGSETYEWDITIPSEEPEFSLKNSELEVQRDMVSCMALLAFKDYNPNPMVALSYETRYFSQFDGILKYPFFLSDSEISVDEYRCDGQERHTESKEFDLKDTVPQWKRGSGISPVIRWDAECQNLEISVSWSDLYTGKVPWFIVTISATNYQYDSIIVDKESMSLEIPYSESSMGNRFTVTVHITTCTPSGQLRSNVFVPQTCTPGHQDESGSLSEPESESSDEPDLSDDMPDTPPPPPPLPETRRPSTRSIRRMWGDPHLQTIDGVEYTFNGIGEYVLLRTIEHEPVFQIQILLSPVSEDDFKGSVITALALQLEDSIVEYDLEDGLFVDKLPVEVEGDEGQFDVPGSKLEVSWNTDQETGNFILDFEITEGKAGADDVMLFRGIVSRTGFNLVHSLPIFAFENTEGLLGLWDENSSNDLVTSNGEIVDPEASEAQVYEFGMSWLLSNIPDAPESLFHKEHNDLKPEEFEPTFVEDVDVDKTDQLTQDICKANTDTDTEFKRCLLDVAATNDVEMATVTKTLEKVESEIVKQMVKIPSQIEGIFASEIEATGAFISWNNLRGQYRDTPYFVKFIVINFSSASGDNFQIDTAFDVDGVYAHLEPETQYTISAVLYNDAGHSPTSESRRFTTPSIESSSFSDSDINGSPPPHIGVQTSLFIVLALLICCI